MTGAREARQEWLWVLAFALWAGVLVATWPAGLSFGDEVGYVGQMRLLLQGRFRPLPGDPGVWIATAHGAVAKYPYFVPMLLTPLLAIHPRLIFVIGPLPVLGLVFVGARVLRAWERSASWALVLLLHPTITILSRTAMTDLLLTALIVGTWWAGRRDRVGLAALLAAGAALTKAVGFVIVAGLIAGEVLRERQALRRRQPAALRRIAFMAGGLAIGFAGVIALNFLANGTPWFEYGDAHRQVGKSSFDPSYLLTSAPLHLESLLLVPPLLAAGAWPYWKRREWGPLVASGGLFLMMCVYFFVDHGRTWIETLLMGPRLLLPAIGFLLIWYADVLAGLWLRLRAHAAPPVLAALLPALIALPISLRHRAWQQPDARALAAASAAVAAAGDHVLGLTVTSSKSGMLFMGQTVEIEPGARPRVILCGTQYPSYRDPNDPAGAYNCALPGYQKLETVGASLVLRRRDP